MSFEGQGSNSWPAPEDDGNIAGAAGRPPPAPAPSLFEILAAHRKVGAPFELAWRRARYGQHDIDAEVKAVWRRAYEGRPTPAEAAVAMLDDSRFV